jgi:hypothetical protein
MLPLTTTTFISHDAAWWDTVGRGLQQFFEFAVGVVRFDVYQTDNSAIAWYSIAYKYHPLLPTPYTITRIVQIRNLNFN